jgi:hypothetical protein
MPGNSDGFAGTSDSQQPKSLIPLGETETHLDLSESEGEDPLQRAKPPPPKVRITRRGGRVQHSRGSLAGEAEPQHSRRSVRES